MRKGFVHNGNCCRNCSYCGGDGEEQQKQPSPSHVRRVRVELEKWKAGERKFPPKFVWANSQPPQAFIRLYNEFGLQAQAFHAQRQPGRPRQRMATARPRPYQPKLPMNLMQLQRKRFTARAQSSKQRLARLRAGLLLWKQGHKPSPPRFAGKPTPAVSALFAEFGLDPWQFCLPGRPDVPDHFESDLHEFASTCERIEATLERASPIQREGQKPSQENTEEQPHAND